MCTDVDIDRWVMRMKAASDGGGDAEDWHIEADLILCTLLVSLGYGRVVAAFHDVEKWYT